MHVQRWVQLKARRLQTWGEMPMSTKVKSSKDERLNTQKEIPSWLSEIAKSLFKIKIFCQYKHKYGFNHVLINE